MDLGWWISSDETNQPGLFYGTFRTKSGFSEDSAKMELDFFFYFLVFQKMGFGQMNEMSIEWMNQ